VQQRSLRKFGANAATAQIIHVETFFENLCPFREQQFRIRHEDSEADSEAWLVGCFD
jgi:hypothetical protein